MGEHAVRRNCVEDGQGGRPVLQDGDVPHVRHAGSEQIDPKRV